MLEGALDFPNFPFRFVLKKEIRKIEENPLLQIFYGNNLNKNSCQSAAAAAARAAKLVLECTSNIKRIKYCFFLFFVLFVFCASFSSCATFLSYVLQF